MDNNNTNMAVKKPIVQQDNNSLSAKELWYLCLDHWRWFVLSVIVCLGLAAFYLLITPKTYTRSASILIKQESRGKSIDQDLAQAFGNMGLSSSNTNIMNELSIITSKDMARSVVKRIALNVNYKVSGKFRDKILYGTSLPIKAEFPGLNDNDIVSFDVDFLKDNKIKLSNFTKNGESFSGEVNGTIGYNIANTPVGRIVVLKSPNYNKQNTQRTIHVKRSAIDSARDNLLGRYSGELNNKQGGTIINLTVKDHSAQRGEDILNTIIAIYKENWIKDRNEIALSTSEFIDDRLEVIEKELGNVDNNISSYKTSHQITDINQASNLYLQQTKEADTRILALNSQLYMARNIRSYLVNNDKSFQLLPVNSGIESASIENQIRDYNNRLLQRNNIVANSSEQSPIVVDIDKQLIELRTSIINSIDNEITTLQTQIDAQRGYAGSATQKIASSPGQQKYLLSVERQQKVKESLYLFLLQKREENELSQAFTAYNTRIVNAPQGSRYPTAPVTNRILLLGLLAGLCIPFGIIYLRENMNTTVRGKKDIDEKLSMPYLGEIPIYPNNIPNKRYRFWEKKRVPRSIVVREGSRGIMNEAFRVIGTNLEFMSGGNNGDKKNVIMITSYNPGSGKSFIVANIGATFAIKRKRVLIIDGDLRHASSSRCVDNPKPGLADYLSGMSTELDSLIKAVPGFKNFDVLPVGTIPPNPTELLGSPLFGDMINSLRDRYDYIFIDCPPADMMADATIIAKHIDRTLFIIRAGLFERSLLTQLENESKNDKFKNMTYILNGIEPKRGRYGYKYGYGKYGYGYGKHSYGYGYGYGYASNEQE